jgi:hypothetical protein
LPGIEIRVAHYPPYTSKYNPIEHRWFPHVSSMGQGVIFESVQTVKELMEKISNAQFKHLALHSSKPAA